MSRKSPCTSRPCHATSSKRPSICILAVPSRRASTTWPFVRMANSSLSAWTGTGELESRMLAPAHKALNERIPATPGGDRKTRTPCEAMRQAYQLTGVVGEIRLVVQDKPEMGRIGIVVSLVRTLFQARPRAAIVAALSPCGPTTVRGFTTSIVHSDRLGSIEHGSLHKPIHACVAYGYEDVQGLGRRLPRQERGAIPTGGK